MTIRQLYKIFYQAFHRVPDDREEKQLVYMAQGRLPEDEIWSIPGDKGD